MPFGRIGKQSNRSQHALPILDPPSNPEAVLEPASATNSRSASTHESFDSRTQLQHPGQQQQLQPPPPQQPDSQQPPQPPPHIYNTTSPPLVSPNPGGSPHDFADLVSRSQSQRYPAPPLQTQYSGAAASSSVDDLGQTTSHSPSQLPSPPGGHYQQHPPPEPKRSTRKLIKGIFTGGSRAPDHNPQQQQQQQQQQGHYDNTGGLARRPSKRVSNSNPPNVRVNISQLSQASLDQDPGAPPDWQSPQQAHNQSPLSGVGEIDERFYRRDSNFDSHLQNHNPPFNPTIRPVQPSEDPGYQQDPQRHYQQGDFDHHQQYQYNPPAPPVQYQPGLPQLHTSHLTAVPQHQNPETSSQVSRESPVTDSDPPSTHLQSAQVSPSATFGNNQAQENPLPPLPPEAQPESQQQQAPMVPGGQAVRRSQDTDKTRPQDGQPGAPPPYGRNPGSMNQINAMAPPAPGNQSNPTLRGGGGAAGQDRIPYDGSAGGDPQGRNSPQPSTLEREDAEKTSRDILTKYKNVKRLYFDGKAQIELMSVQIEQLQNAIANQRMSQSRTALDDSEYTTRFNRMNGAINNLSFNIRKDWRTVPRWLEMYISSDALKTGKQEMTAVGRAVITRWIVEEVFNKCFHPGLEAGLSRQLKKIEMDIRRYSYTMSSQEEYDALTTKVVNWRMATLEGLSRDLNSPESADHRADFTRKLTSNLTAALYSFLNDPPPPGVEGSASMIVELAVGIAANLPLESRDVAITHPLPGDLVQPAIMEVEKAGLPPLESQKEGDEAAEDSGDAKEKSKDRRDRSKTAPSGPLKDANKVRLAGFVAVEVRGRQVLMKAPIWTLG